MKNIILPIFYVPPVSWFVEFLREDQAVILEQYENFPKQTYRNRANIYGANGKLSLIIPVQHKKGRGMNEIQVSDKENWRSIHWKSIQSAYQGSPYFEFYEDQFKKIFNSEETSLLKLNLSVIEIIQKILKTNVEFALSEEYKHDFEGADFRNQFSAKNSEVLGYDDYYQTFTEKHGFLENLSIIDLLCNKGPESLMYIKKLQK